MTDWKTTILALGPCEDAAVWVMDREGSAYAAWRACERGDWLLWIAARLGVDRRLVVRAACACARTALVHVPEGEHRPLRAIETAEAWCDGRATIAEVRAAYAAASRAAATTASRAAAAASRAAATTASRAAAAAANAAATTAAANVADYAASAYAYAARAAAHAAAHANTADAAAHRDHSRLVRRLIPWRVVKRAMAHSAT